MLASSPLLLHSRDKCLQDLKPGWRGWGWEMEESKVTPLKLQLKGPQIHAHAVP